MCAELDYVQLGELIIWMMDFLMDLSDLTMILNDTRIDLVVVMLILAMSRLGLPQS